MSQIDQIIQLMLRQGDIDAQEQRERIAADEERRQAKHRVLKTTLKYLAQYGPMFIPGVGPFAGAAIGAGVGAADRAFLDPATNPDILVKQRGY